MKPKASKREDYTYKRNGTASLLMAYNIHTGERVAQIRKHRTANDYAEFMQSLADRQPGIHRIHLMEDNLNTHKNGGSSWIQLETSIQAAQTQVMKRSF
jgi:hypothetical protein